MSRNGWAWSSGNPLSIDRPDGGHDGTELRYHKADVPGSRLPHRFDLVGECRGTGTLSAPRREMRSPHKGKPHTNPGGGTLDVRKSRCAAVSQGSGGRLIKIDLRSRDDTEAVGVRVVRRLGDAPHRTSPLPLGTRRCSMSKWHRPH